MYWADKTGTAHACKGRGISTHCRYGIIPDRMGDPADPFRKLGEVKFWGGVASAAEPSKDPFFYNLFSFLPGVIRHPLFLIFLPAVCSLYHPQPVHMGCPVAGKARSLPVTCQTNGSQRSSADATEVLLQDCVLLFLIFCVMKRMGTGCGSEQAKNSMEFLQIRIQIQTKEGHLSCMS